MKRANKLMLVAATELTLGTKLSIDQVTTVNRPVSEAAGHAVPARNE